MRTVVNVSLLLFSAFGCTPLTAAGERVRVVERSEQVQDCEYLGKIEGSGRNNAPGEKIGGNAMIAANSAENDARNKAAKLGADTLLNLETEQAHFSAEAKAGAYRCGGARTPQAEQCFPSGVGCGAPGSVCCDGLTCNKRPDGMVCEPPPAVAAAPVPTARPCLQMSQECGTSSDVCCAGLSCVSREYNHAQCEAASPSGGSATSAEPADEGALAE